MTMFTIPAEFSGASTHRDGGMGLRFTTCELSAEHKAVAMGYVQQYGHLAFSPNQVQASDIPSEPAQDGKTPSKRLRNTIYCYYEQLGGKDVKGEFEQFYRRQMDAIIDKYKSKLD